ncbi:MAG: endolytic transglycosylase MltG, partial [Actinobacteria bacterium]|nr:endolytic transglycosylase MltG [Actinomycetota bacterium]
VLVSSVINNRLADGIRLEIDATVLYAMRTRDVAEFNREFDSPYNTYLIEGLPPTPISAPGRASLEAAAAPADTPFYFYVLADLEGGHAFAETFEEHQANIAQAREDGVLP